MRRSALPFIFAALSLVACGDNGTARLTGADVAAGLSDVVVRAASVCHGAMPLVSAASLVPVPQVAVIAGAVSAMCYPLLAGVVPTTLDANTVAWLDRNLVDLRNLTEHRT